MANDDPYLRGLQRRMAHNQAAEAAARADLSAHVANGDEDGIGESEQQIADVRAQQRNLASLAQEYIASKNPPAPQEVSAEERAARPPERMDWTDVANLARTCKYAADLKDDDPNMLRGY
jgi:uncharacterized membrane protein